MTTIDTEADPIAPLAALVASVAGRGRAAAIQLGPPAAPGPGAGAGAWLPAGHLADPRRPHLGDLLRALAAGWGAPPRPAALVAWKTYSHRVTYPVALGWALNRRVPLAGMEQVLVRHESGQPWLRVAVPRPVLAVLSRDRCAGAPGTVVVEDEPALLATARAALIDRHLAPVAACLRRLAPVGGRPLWGSVAAALANPLLTNAAALPGDARAEARALLAGMGPGLGRLVEILPEPGAGPPSGARLRRRTCCLAFAVPGFGECASCPRDGSAGREPGS